MSSIQQRPISTAAKSAPSPSASSQPGSPASDYRPSARLMDSVGAFVFTVLVFILFVFPSRIIASPWTSDHTEGWLHVFDTSRQSILLAPTVYITPNPTSHTIPRFAQPHDHHLANPYSLMRPMQSLEPETTASRINRLGHFGRMIRNPTIIEKHTWAHEYMNELVDAVLDSIHQDAVHTLRSGPRLIDPPKYSNAHVGVAIIYDAKVKKEQEKARVHDAHISSLQAVFESVGWMMVPLGLLAMVKLFAYVWLIAVKVVGNVGMCIPAVNAIHKSKLAKVEEQYKKQMEALQAAHRLQVANLARIIDNKDRQLEGAMLESIDQATVAAHELEVAKAVFARWHEARGTEMAVQSTRIKQLQLEVFLDGTRHELAETRRELRATERQMRAMSREHHQGFVHEREGLMKAIAEAYKERDIAQVAKSDAVRRLKAHSAPAKPAVQVVDVAEGMVADDWPHCLLSIEDELAAAQVRLELRQASAPTVQRLPTKPTRTESLCSMVLVKIMSAVADAETKYK
ncbi:hypothetical protein BCR44DRAFT_1536259 [Catenaria anguillulae PL171]|uniref:Uncharacterized protein n=1 Tax=Catenaria anguillulae PL171 TaxID=765915 RepID=A0A1Y2HZ86_9FUNG|nr:hypothetical protein BCR44DRAFT_1536259 [Catenaria anguillulae PL171]